MNNIYMPADDPQIKRMTDIFELDDKVVLYA